MSNEKYDEASIKTGEDLKTIAAQPDIASVSQLSLPEIDAVSDAVSRVVPAGNVPGVILSGLVRLPGRKVPLKTVKRDVHLLFKGVEQTLDQAVYAALFAGPAAVLWGYQNILRLAGKSQESAFPEGAWQFYVDYALREDSARHTNETHGFDSALRQHQIQLSTADRLTAWVMASVHILHQYNQLLENEWRERVYTAILQEVTNQLPETKQYTRLYKDAWQKQIPYRRGREAADQTYPQYRRTVFDSFLQPYLDQLPEDLRKTWQQAVLQAEASELPNYMRQMSILAYLKPDLYSETRVTLPIEQTSIGLIYGGHYYLIPTCIPDTSQPVDVETVRAQICSLVEYSYPQPPTSLVPLVKMRRAALSELLETFNKDLSDSLKGLQCAPILINADLVSHQQPLAKLRQTERGIGGHPLTILQSGETFIFDQSHIFFDGAWGAALAEIFTNEALSWAVYLVAARPSFLTPPKPIAPLAWRLNSSQIKAITSAPQVAAEASAESDQLNLQAIANLRELLKRRNDNILLTVNDLLVLYRAIHVFAYQPDVELIEALNSLAAQTAGHKAAIAALESIELSRHTNPAMLIPVSAGHRKPADRLVPWSFEVPLADLDLINLHISTMKALEAYLNAEGDRSPTYNRFYSLQVTYLATLGGFGEVMSKAKEIAFAGESTSVGVIKLMGHLPAALQRLLDKIPSQIDLLNDIIKGREVFSNIGAVAPTSTLTRFISAKDDNEKKTLVWGVMTDNLGIPHITLRDFRPHVQLLQAAGQAELANWIARDYLNSYVKGMNRFIIDLRRITIASRSVRLSTMKQYHAAR